MSVFESAVIVPPMAAAPWTPGYRLAMWIPPPLVTVSETTLCDTVMSVPP